MRVIKSGMSYIVDLGPDAPYRFHTILKNRTCMCPSRDKCEYVEYVINWLKETGTPTTPGQLNVPPGKIACPICGSGIIMDVLDHKDFKKVQYWSCETAGRIHYWQHRGEPFKEWFFREDIIPGLVKRGDLDPDTKLGYDPESNH